MKTGPSNCRIRTDDERADSGDVQPRHEQDIGTTIIQDNATRLSENLQTERITKSQHKLYQWIGQRLNVAILVHVVHSCGSYCFHACCCAVPGSSFSCFAL